MADSPEEVAKIALDAARDEFTAAKKAAKKNPGDLVAHDARRSARRRLREARQRYRLADPTRPDDPNTLRVRTDDNQAAKDAPERN